MHTSIARLILHPRDIQYVPEDLSHIVKQLQIIQFIGKPLSDSNHFLVGDEFINLLTFLGCSPNIHLSPEDGGNFCSFFIPEIHEKNTLLGYTSMVVPRCPECKHKIIDWKQHFHEWKKGDYLYHCSQCLKETPVSQLKWRQEGGYGRFSICISHIHPHEAVPSEKLLNTLQKASNTSWTYFYANN